MLSLPNDGRYPALALTPVAAPAKNAGSAHAKSRRLHANNPVLMIFEDVHWTDPTSLEAFGRAVDRVKTLPVLLIVTPAPSSTRRGWASRV